MVPFGGLKRSARLSRGGEKLEHMLERCHPANRESVRQRLAAARDGTGPTLFDWIVEIIKIHCPGGSEAEDNVLLILD